MNKIQFTYQRWFLRNCCALVGLPFAVKIQELIVGLLDVDAASSWYTLIGAVITFCWVSFYYKFTQKHNWFERTATYWINDGTVYVQNRKKVYEIKEVKWLKGATASFYGISKSGMLVIQLSKRKLVYISSQPKEVKSFEDCELFQLFQAILEYNTELVKDDTEEFLYENKG